MLDIHIQPFCTPNFVSVLAPNAHTSSTAFHLSHVSAEKLSKMCDEFRAKIFQKAGKKDPNFERKP